MPIKHHIHKVKIGKDLLYPLKFSDVETCCTDLTPELLCLNVSFSGYSAYTRNRLEQLRTVGSEVLRCDYDRFDARSGYLNQVPADTPRISVTVHAMPLEVVREYQIRRQALRDAFETLVRLLNPRGLAADQWRFAIDFVPEEAPIFKCRYRAWTGIREGTEKTFTLPVAPADLEK